MGVAGIDLGTTFSAIAIIDEFNRPKILLNREGEQTTHSSIFFNNGVNPIVGREAKNQAEGEISNYIDLVKRDMGNQNYKKYIDANNKNYTPELLSALILKKIKIDAEFRGSEINDVVITVPAYFNDKQKMATFQAGEIAGLNVLRIINEPTAAALAYIEKKPEVQNKTIMIYDLGGGTFDVSVVVISNRNIIVKATGGDPYLGGYDFDEIIINWVKNEILKQDSTISFNREDEFLLKEKAEIWKKSLSISNKTPINFTTQSNFRLKTELTRDIFEKITSHLLEKTKKTVLDILKLAELEWKNIDEIVLVGGSTRMLMVKNMLTSLSGKTIKEDIEPDLCVAEGAAIAAMLEKKGNNYIEEWSDITSHGLGVAIRSSDQKDESYYNSVIIPKFSKLPAKQSKRFKIEKDSTTVICQIYQGEHNEPVNNCIGIGNLILENIPKRTDSDATIEIVLEYDKNGIIQANIIDLFSGMTKHGEIDQRSSLSKKEIEDDKEYIKEFILSSN